MGQMAYFPPLRNNPLSPMSKIGGESPTPKDRRERRAVAEAHQTANDIAAFLSRYSPAVVLGADGNTYEVEAIKSTTGQSNREFWSVAFLGASVNIAIPLCSFVTTNASYPDITVNGQPSDHVVPENNVLPVPVGTSHLFLECSVDDTKPEGLHTQSVKVVALQTSTITNTLTKRYVPIVSIDTTTKQKSRPYLSGAIQTFRRGDREDISNMVVLPF